MKNVSLKGAHLSALQTHLWPLLQDNPAYYVQCAVSIRGYLDTELFQRAVQSLLERHEILRTIFHFVPGMNNPMQVIDPASSWHCAIIHLEGLETSAWTAHIQEHFLSASKEPFMLTQGPLGRVTLLRRADNEHVLLLRLPALCADSATLKHLLTELEQAYASLSMGEEPAGDEPLQYIDVSSWQKDLLTADGAEVANTIPKLFTEHSEHR